MKNLSELWKQHPEAIGAVMVAVWSAVAIVAAFFLLGGDDTPEAFESSVTSGGLGTQTALMTTPTPGETVTQLQEVELPNGSTVTATVRAYVTTSVDGTPQVVRATVMETAPGKTVTSQVTSRATAIVTAPGRNSTVTAPGSTITAAGGGFTVTAPGGERTVTVTEPGPTTTVIQPGPTTTVLEPGPTVTVTEPAVTITISLNPGGRPTGEE